MNCGRSAMESGQSAVESRICPETLPSLVDWISEPRTVCQGGPDSPQVGLESVPETLLSLVGWRRCIADSPLRVSGQSASQYRKFSRNIGGSGGSAELIRGRSATWARTIRSTFHFEV